jgi:crotonobetainyl-CoA:carnitine CoA-transferase CaiB-like acyl-CoA transferase
MAVAPDIATGLRIVEIGSSAAVGLAGMVLADAGAEVLLIEPPSGSSLRREPAFSMWARGKQSVVADLGEAAGAEHARSLIREADVLLLGLKPASVERLGLEYEALAADAPQLVHAGLSGFGSRGPFRDVPVYDGVMQARGGRMADFSPLFDGRRPAFAAAPVAAFGAAMALLQGVFGALRQRERNGGRGQRIESSLARALTFYDLGQWVPGGPFPLRLEDSPFLPYAVARSADGVWLQFAQNGPALFADFMRVLGLEDEIDYATVMAGAATGPGDSAEKRALRERIQARVAEATWSEWQERLAKERNLSVERFHAPGEALAHPQFEAIGDVVRVPGASGQPTQQLGPLFEVPARPLRPHGPPPLLGSAVETGFASAPGARPASAIADAEGAGLLAGVTVLELGMWIALPFAATQLAELGARVIKLEPLAGDPMRAMGPFSFKIVQGKESLALDLKRPEAREIVQRLVLRADALLHSYRPGVPERLGIDFETLRTINPRLVHLYNGSYGSRGPKCNAPAFHVTGGAIAGGAAAQAGAGCPPPAEAVLSREEMARISRRLELANEANPDFNSAVTAAAALTMGLYARERTGEGLAIETRMMLSNAMMMSADFIEYSGRPERREPDADLLGLGPLYRLYPAAEGWVFLAAPQPRDFARLCQALGLEDLPRDPRFATPEARAVHADALAGALGDALSRRPADELEAELTASGVACVRADQGPYRSWLFEQEWAREDGLVQEVRQSLVGPYTRYGPPIANDRPAPLAGAFESGAQTRALLDELGFSTREIEAFLDKGVVAQAGDDRES